MPFACVGLDWARPLFLFQKIALIKLLLRLRSQVRIGVRAVYPEPFRGWKQNQRANKEEEALQGKPSTAINKAYELTTPSTTLARNA
jgi:hypothetical protein